LGAIRIVGGMSPGDMIVYDEKRDAWIYKPVVKKNGRASIDGKYV